MASLAPDQVQPTTLDAILRSGELDDYVPGIPDPATEAVRVHADIVHEMHCPLCGRRTVSLRPFVRARGHGYRAYSRCRSCGHTEALR